MRLPPLPLLFASLLATSHPSSAAPRSPEEMRSPANVVFQFGREDTSAPWGDGTTSKARSYLWIPEQCRKLRGILVLCANVPEQMLAGHEAIRAVCRANDLGIVWCSGTFFSFKKSGPGGAREDAKSVAFLQQILDGFAQTTGYPEVATVPWLPIGESAHLLMVDALVEQAPGRAIAGIWLKNPHVPPHDRATPGLIIYGAGQEWAQDKPDDKHTTFLTRWSSHADHYNAIVAERKAHPDWPLSYAIDGGSGHFDCSENVVAMVARYIDLAAKARLSRDGTVNLLPVDLTRGWLADLPVPGHESQPPRPWGKVPESERALPWFFDEASAKVAQAFSRTNWQAESQFPAFAMPDGTVFPFTFNGIASITLNAAPKPFNDPATGQPATPPVLTTDADGITFHLRGVLLEKVPASFVGAGAGEKLARTPGAPVLEWAAGSVEPLGSGAFRLAPDRNWGNPVYLIARQPSTATVRAVVQPAGLPRDYNLEGTAQTITFDPISDVKPGAAPVTLKATASSGLPVGFFVDAGPAIIKGNQLVFTPIPPGAKYPITVTVGAWQLGRWAEPKVKRADIAKQSFRILPRD